MKKLLTTSFFVICLISSFSINAQVNLRLGKYSSNIANFKDTTRDALKIASFILSTQEFKDSLLKFQFKCANIPKNKREECCEFIAGERVYDSLTKYPDTTINITIKKLSRLERISDPHDQIGFSREGRYSITTRSWYLKEKITRTRFASAVYAAHLAHEYCHIRGYYHISGQDYGEDVAETVGNLVRKIIRRRLKQGEPFK